MLQKQGKDDFREELQYVIEHISRCFSDALPNGFETISEKLRPIGFDETHEQISSVM